MLFRASADASADVRAASDHRAARRLGSVVCPTGCLVVGDAGYLGMWSGEDEPQPPRLFGDPGTMTELGAAKDLRIRGRDAAAAARALNLQSLTYLYEVPDPEAIAHPFTALVARTGLDAVLEMEPKRVAHAERARRAARAGGSDFLVWGVWMSAVDGLPVDRPLPVLGNPLDDGLNPGWESVWVEVSDRAPARTETVGWISVDWAHVIFADVASLSAWVHEASLDGRADVVYWGDDQDECRAAFGGDLLRDGELGWRDLPDDEAQRHVLALESWRDHDARSVVVDYRPHSHHHRIMRTIGSDEDQVAELELGDGRVFAMVTGGRDGVFDVEVDRAADGSLTAVRVVVASYRGCGGHGGVHSGARYGAARVHPGS